MVLDHRHQQDTGEDQNRSQYFVIDSLLLPEMEIAVNQSEDGGRFKDDVHNGRSGDILKKMQLAVKAIKFPLQGGGD
jgi:hypothetical protein